MATLMLCALIYSFIGWAYETVLYTIYLKRFVNRGFLHGPLCPIYGLGAVLIILCIYGRTDSVPCIFFGGMLLSISLELTTGILLEKLFDKKWWDYTLFPLNFRGIVCVPGAVVFALMSVLLIKYIHPFVLMKLSVIPPNVSAVIAAVALAFFTADFYYTVKDETGNDGIISWLKYKL